jgi:hypothetical protein
MISMGCGNPAICQAIEFIILFKYALCKMKLVAGERRAGAKKRETSEGKYSAKNESVHGA